MFREVKILRERHSSAGHRPGRTQYTVYNIILPDDGIMLLGKDSIGLIIPEYRIIKPSRREHTGPRHNSEETDAKKNRVRERDEHKKETERLKNCRQNSLREVRINGAA